jgi:hypothetical protein
MNWICEYLLAYRKGHFISACSFNLFPHNPMSCAITIWRGRHGYVNQTSRSDHFQRTPHIYREKTSVEPLLPFTVDPNCFLLNEVKDLGVELTLSSVIDQAPDQLV